MSDSQDDRVGADFDRFAVLRTAESLAKSYPGGIPRKLLDLMKHRSADKNSPIREVSAQFVVPTALSREEEVFLEAAVTKGLEWPIERVLVLSLAELPAEIVVPTIFCIGDRGDSLSLFLEAGLSKRGEWVSFQKSQIVWTGSLSEAASRRESKRELWNVLQNLR